MTAFQTCPSLHFHQIRLWLPDVTISGVRLPLRVASHWAATFGWRVTKSLNPGRTRLPVQYGQPAFLATRDAITDCHPCPREHLHQAFLLLYGITRSGVNPPFRSMFHSAARTGKRVNKSFSPEAVIFPLQTGQPLPRALFKILARHECPFLHRHQTYC